jgi:hypothetical protein
MVATGVMAGIEVGIHENTLVPSCEVLPDPRPLRRRAVGFQADPKIGWVEESQVELRLPVQSVAGPSSLSDLGGEDILE